MIFRRLSRRFASAAPRTAHQKIKDELLTNPAFDDAFPHLSKFKEPTRIPMEKKELDFIKSLL